MNTNSASSRVLSTVYWPGGIQFVPKGWTHSTEERTLQIGVPAKGAFTEFVNVAYDENRNKTSITGFSINVFKAAVNNLPYDLEFKFVPFNGSYDEMVEQVYNKVFPKDSTLATDISEALLKVIESGETEQLENDMLTIGGNASCSPKAKDGSSTGFQPFLGLFYICSIVAILALLYNMICLFMKNVETFTSYIHVTLTQLKRIWRWTTTYFSRSCSRLQSGSMRSVTIATVTRNAEETVINSQQSTVVVELIDVVLATHASRAIDFSNCCKKHFTAKDLKDLDTHFLLVILRQYDVLR
ncbi:Glutamate receptor 2.5 [Spatholobus suberectus]|nr:Glutamate receptor 2.5 [Spatholobus suberectus]